MNSQMVKTVEQIREAKRAKGIATILAIGTANPPNFILQEEYPDIYFRDVPNSAEQLHTMKLKFKRICEKSKIDKRHTVLTEEFLKQNTEDGNYESLSMEKRLKLPTEEVVKLGHEAAMKAMKEWGQHISQITHLIFYTTSCIGSVPGPDCHLAKLLGLKPTVQRLMMFFHGCHAGGAILRAAKHIAENNVGSRVLVVCAETMLATFQKPTTSLTTDVLIGHALYGDGAAAMIIGTDPNPSFERPLFEIVLASQTTVPDTEDVIRAQMPGEMGRLVYRIDKNLPNIIFDNVEKCLIDELGSIGLINNEIDWNKFFYAIHPGGPLILNKVEEKLGLTKEKLEVSWHVLRQYGNMWSPTVIFILDELRKKSRIEGKSTTGEGLEWGILLGFGPGVSMETVVLHSVCVHE